MSKQIELNGVRLLADGDMSPEELAALRRAFTPRRADPAAVEALDALAAFVWQNRDTGGGVAAGDLLRSLFDGHRCDLSGIMRLDPDWREKMLLVLANIGYRPLWDYSIRDAFHRVGGPAAVDWFTTFGEEGQP